MEFYLIYQPLLVLDREAQVRFLNVSLHRPHPALPASLLPSQTIKEAGVEQLLQSLSGLQAFLLPDEQIEATNVCTPQQLLYHRLPDEARPAGDEDGLLVVELLYLRHAGWLWAGQGQVGALNQFSSLQVGDAEPD